MIKHNIHINHAHIIIYHTTGHQHTPHQPTPMFKYQKITKIICTLISLYFVIQSQTAYAAPFQAKNKLSALKGLKSFVTLGKQIVSVIDYIDKSKHDSYKAPSLYERNKLLDDKV